MREEGGSGFLHVGVHAAGLLEEDTTTTLGQIGHGSAPPKSLPPVSQRREGGGLIGPRKRVVRDTCGHKPCEFPNHTTTTRRHTSTSLYLHHMQPTPPPKRRIILHNQPPPYVLFRHSSHHHRLCFFLSYHPGRTYAHEQKSLTGLL